MNRIGKIIAGVVIVVVIILMFGLASYLRRSSVQRAAKDFKAEYMGGLKRKVTLYSYDGKILKEYRGRIDLTDSENELQFELNGKRIIIHGGIAVVEEE